MVKNAKLLWVVVGVIAASSQAGAAMLSPGGSVSPDTLTAFPAGTVLADTGTTAFVGVTQNSSTVPFTGVAESWVVKDSGTGTLDFVYQVTNSATSRDDLHRLTMTDFTGYTTDVYTVASSAVSPVSVDRGTSDAVGFQYDPTTGIPPTNTVEVVIKTNATAFTLGNLSIIDGGTANVSAFAPTTGGPNPTPEPGLAVMLSTGLLSLVGGRWLRRGKVGGA
jgi:hypothetical protein